MSTLRTVIGAAACCVAAGCACAGSALAFTAPVSAGPPKPPALAHLDFDGYFPSVTQIHVGDSVSWSINGFHTVTFLAKGQALPPLIIPSSTSVISGALDAAGGSFWFNGKPGQIINPLAAAPAGGPTYGGKGFLSSGLPGGEGPPKPFRVKFSKAGTYVFHCVVHPGMQGVIRVLPKRKSIASAKGDRIAASEQLHAGVIAARALAKVKPGPDTVLAGHDQGAVTWLRFFPQSLTVKAGTAVEFRVSSAREVHTITFGPTAYTSKIEETFTAPLPGGGGGPPTIGVNPLGGYPSDPPPLPPYAGTNHGNGYEGTGVLSLGGGPLPSSAKITFNTPGVYNFECVIHQNMDGKITVTK